MINYRSRKFDHQEVDYWPGFVDAMATILLLIIFLLSVFILSQFFLSVEITGKNSALRKLEIQISELTELLALERVDAQKSQSEIDSLRNSLSSMLEERDRLRQSLRGSHSGSDPTDNIHDNSLNKIEWLNQQIAALRMQILALQEALQAYEVKDKEYQEKISDLGSRLNVALARQVHSLQRYRSEFFGRLQEILGDNQNIQIVGDRFVFQSEVLFPLGQATFNARGKQDLDKVASAIIELAKRIPEDIKWTLQIDGHTDSKPVTNHSRFASNWELSTARAIAVVQYLIEKGVQPQNLVAAGYGEYQPLYDNSSSSLAAKNRRIEIKLTDR